MTPTFANLFHITRNGDSTFRLVFKTKIEALTAETNAIIYMTFADARELAQTLTKMTAHDQASRNFHPLSPHIKCD